MYYYKPTDKNEELLRMRMRDIAENRVRYRQSLKGVDVRDELGRIAAEEQVLPHRLQCDNGSEFISKDVDQWAYENNVTLDFSRPGKPTDNSYVESFNGKFCDECLSVNWFLSLDHAQEIIDQWKWDYNHLRPHSALGDLSPEEYIQTHQHTPENSTFE
jgi:putative transposase